jgi:hypothetical protein
MVVGQGWCMDGRVPLLVRTRVRAGSTDDALDSKDGGWKAEGTGGGFESVVRTSDLRVKDVCGRRGCEFPTSAGDLAADCPQSVT